MKHIALVPFLSLMAVAVSGCDATEVADDAAADVSPLTESFLAEGYRYESDACHMVGESALTLEYLDHTADLVACPEDITLVGNIDGAKEVAQMQGYRLFSVPRE